MLIQSTSALLKFIKDLGTPPYLALDTEFISEKFYYPKLCLIQIAHGSSAAVIDPLADIDLAPLINFLKNPQIIKVFHAAQQDLSILWNNFKLAPSPVFDTQIAAMVCGFGDQISYGQLVKALLKTRLDKSSQIIDWSRRPLLDRHIEYALADVVNLGPIYERLLHDIRTKNRVSWIEEEMRELTQPKQYEFDPETHSKKLKLRYITRRRLAIIYELLSWREDKAKSQNLPRGWVLKDLALRDIGSNPPKNLEALARVRGIGGNARGQSGQEIIQCIQRAQALPLSSCPSVDPGNTHERVNENVLALLRALLKHICTLNKVAPRLVATKADLEKIALGETSRVSEGWRREIFGDSANKLLQGQIALSLVNGKIKIVAMESPG